MILCQYFKNRFRRAQKRFTNGFTLVEMIVVLAIIAILSTILLSSISGWIKRAKRISLKADCRNCVMAAQTLSAEAIGSGKEPDSVTEDDVRKLAGVSGTVSNICFDSPTLQLTHLTYTAGNESVTYCAFYSTCSDHSETYNFDDEQTGSAGLKFETADNTELISMYTSILGSETLMVNDTQSIKEYFTIKDGGFPCIDMSDESSYNKVKDALAEEFKLDLNSFDFAMKNDKWNGLVTLFVSESVADKKKGDEIAARKLAFRINQNTGALTKQEEDALGIITLREDGKYRFTGFGDSVVALFKKK